MIPFSKESKTEKLMGPGSMIVGTRGRVWWWCQFVVVTSSVAVQQGLWLTGLWYICDIW